MRRLDVVNRGFSGYNTTRALAVLPHFMPRPEQDRIRFMVCFTWRRPSRRAAMADLDTSRKTIFFGANDACLPGGSTGQHVPLKEYVQNLKKIVHHPSVQAQSARLLLITPPPVDEYASEAAESLQGLTTEVLRTAEHTKKYADACREVGENLGVAVLDIWSIIMDRAGWAPDRDLPGSKSAPKNTLLQDLLTDGKVKKKRRHP